MNLFYKLCIFVLFSSALMAQDVTGNYSLQGIHDMAAGFEFNADSSFRFFYAYGAVDRTAEGTYSVAGNKIILKSKKEPGKDFTVTKQLDDTTGYIIKVNNPNQYLARHVRCVVLNGEKQEVFFADDDGVIHINMTAAEKIYLQHELYPDILTMIKDEKNKNHYFEVQLNPSLEQVSFKGIDLTINDDTLTWLPNYFIPEENVRFVKNK